MTPHIFHHTDPLDATRALCTQGARGVLLFDSGRAIDASPHAPRWSILLHEPSRILTSRDGRYVELVGPERAEHAVDDPIAWLRHFARSERCPPVHLLDSHGERVPFVGGLAGYLGFEFASMLDDVDFEMALTHHPSMTRAPLLWVGHYEPEQVQLFRHVGPSFSSSTRAISQRITPRIWSEVARDGSWSLLDERASQEHYQQSVRACIEAIVERGDLFEMSYAERFFAFVGMEPLDFYGEMRRLSTGNHMAYLCDDGAWALASVSPEQFLSCEEDRLVTRPIKGTRRRAPDDPELDARLASELLQSQKDRAENIMIVDLMRNDLTQVCKLGSVRAETICGLESFDGVHHLVSTITGTLEPGYGALDALLASFPAGSITGAPKLRSMEYIADLEQSRRGPYTGSMFYVSRCGRMDSSVLIRTAEIGQSRDASGVMRRCAWYGAGGAVVSRSDAAQEWEEALLKARQFFAVAAMGAP